MSDEMFYLTKEDLAILKLLIAQSKGTVRRARPEGISEDFSQASDVYIALPPSGGIPALTSAAVAGTGTETVVPSDGDTPGSAECDIYTIQDGALAYTGFTQTVYNLSSSDIAGTSWIQVIKDKYGSWLAVVGGGSSGGPILGTARNIGYAGSTTEFNTVDGTLTAYVRQGMVFDASAVTYLLQNITGSIYDYEVMNPDIEIIGAITTDVAKDSIGNVHIYYPDVTVTGDILLNVSCRYAAVSAGSRVRCRWLHNSTWEVVNAECEVVETGTGTGTGT